MHQVVPVCMPSVAARCVFLLMLAVLRLGVLSVACFAPER